jgi:hypothetical protein
MSDDKLRAAYNTYVNHNAPRDRSGCPTPEQLQALAESGQGGSSTNLKMLDHVFSCAFCRADFALLRAVQTGVQTDVQSSSRTEQAAGTKTETRRRWFTGPRIAIAASLLFAIGIGSESLRRARSPELRGSPTDASDVVIVSPPANATTSPDAPFVWRKVAGAVSYELQLLDSAGGVITSQVTSDTVYTPNSDERARIAALSKLDWFVSARRSDGNERRSAITRVRVKATGRR